MAVCYGRVQHGDQRDLNEHWVHHLRIASGSLLNRTHVPIRVSLNGQQFEPAADVGAPLSMQYLTLPVTSYVVPNIGPVAGGSTIQIFGEHFGFGSTRRCRFGDHTGAIETDVVATVFSTSLSGDGTMHLTTKPSHIRRDGPATKRAGRPLPQGQRERHAILVAAASLCVS